MSENPSSTMPQHQFVVQLKFAEAILLAIKMFSVQGDCIDGMTAFGVIFSKDEKQFSKVVDGLAYDEWFKGLLHSIRRVWFGMSKQEQVAFRKYTDGLVNEAEKSRGKT